jgi:hypothetical protein
VANPVKASHARGHRLSRFRKLIVGSSGNPGSMSIKN